jgi:ferric-chelate reductase
MRVRRPLKSPMPELVLTAATASLAPFYPLFCSLVEQSTKSPLRISVHYTRASKTATPMEGTAPGVSLNPGRPRLSKVLDTVMTRVVTLGSGEKDEEAPCGVFVGVCGPPGLRDEVAGVIREVDSGRRDRVGGVDVYEECVSFFHLSLLPFAVGLRIAFHCRVFGW